MRILCLGAVLFQSTARVASAASEAKGSNVVGNLRPTTARENHASDVLIDEDGEYWGRYLDAESSIPPSSTPPPDEETRLPTVGIIGAGVGGLTSAYLLQRKGYKVAVLEKADKVGGFARTNFVNGKAYDNSILWTPGGSIGGAGIEPTHQMLIDVAGSTLTPDGTDFYTYDTTEGRLKVIPEPLQEYEHEDIVSQLLNGLELSTQLFLCAVDPTNCLSCEVCADVNMPLLAWGEKMGVPSYAKLATFVFDGLAAGPAAFAATFRSTLSDFLAVDAADLLRNLGVTVETLPEGTSPNIISLLSSQRWYFFQDGWQSFFDDLVRNAGINVMLSSGVDKMEYNENVKQWQILDTSGSGDMHEFDHVIVTTSPKDALDFLPDGPQKELMRKGVARAPPNDVFLVKVDGSLEVEADAELNIPSGSDIVAFWPSGLGLGSESLIAPSDYPTKPFAWQKRHEDDNWIVGTYNFIGATPEETFEIIQSYGKNILGLNVQEMLYHEQYIFPSGPVDFDAWNNDWGNLQGKNGLWFTGEGMSGSGVQRVTSFTQGLISSAFPPLNA